MATEDPKGIQRDLGYDPAPKNYSLSGKIMLTAIVILFTVILLILCLHVYARCFLLRHRRNRVRRQRSRLFVDRYQNPAAASSGLDASVLRSLPVFVFSSETHQDVLECAVCLSEFEENEKGRILPKCNHSFHIDCIDMWFHSHSTCPLCRAAVQPDSSTPSPRVSENRGEIAAAVGSEADLEVGSSSGFCSSCRHGEETGPSSSGSSSSSSESSSSSSGLCSSSSFRKKALGFVGAGIEVPTRRIESFRGLEEVEIVVVSPGGQGLKSPGSRLLSLKRILSRDRRAGVFSSSSSGTEIDPERGEEQHPKPKDEQRKRCDSLPLSPSLPQTQR